MIPALPGPTTDLAHAIVGLWILRTREDHAADGSRRVDPGLGPDPLGMLAFGPGRFAAQFMRRDRACETANALVAPGANNSLAVNGYDAYFGRWTLDAAAGTITVLLDGALAPVSIGQTFTRDIRVEGDTLVIRLATTAGDGTPITRTLTFDRAR